MSYLLDADILAALVRKVARAHARFRPHVGRVHVSVVTLTTMEMWLTRARTPLRHQRSYIALMQDLLILDVNAAVAHQAARVGTILYGQGRRPAIADLLVAGAALVHGLTLVTHDPQAFANIPGLTVADWLTP